MSIGRFLAGMFPTPTMPIQPPPVIAAPTLADIAGAKPGDVPNDHLAAILTTVAPHLSAAALAEWVSALMPWLYHYEITSASRLAMFAGQVAIESYGFARMQEDLVYTTPQRICAVWPSRFPTVESAIPFVRNPVALANKVYSGRMGNKLAGDGWRFRGEGLIELTGRGMYEAFGQSCGKSADDAAAFMLTTAGAAQSACWFWDYRHINDAADAWDIAGATRLINGGEVGIAAREAVCAKALHIAQGWHLV